MNSDKSVVLIHDARIKKVGEQYFLMRISFDYSKKKLLQITEFGKSILEYIKNVRTVKEVVENFSDAADENAIIQYLEFLEGKNYVMLWGRNDVEQFKCLSSLQKEIWMEDHTPYGATIELTAHCNFRCVHCYLDNTHNAEELSLSQIKYIIDRLAEAGMLTLFLSGGEPLLRSDFKEIYLYAKKKGFLIAIFTNGYLLDDELLELFLEYPPLEIDISLYGSNDDMYEKVTGIKGAFTKIHNAIVKYKKNGIFISAKTPVLTLMKDDLSNMQKVSKELNIPWRITFDIVPTIDNVSKENYRISADKAVALYKKYGDTFLADKDILKNALKSGGYIGRRRYACGMGKSSCFIDYRGFVSPCIETRHRGISIFDYDFTAIWNKIRNISYETIAKNEKYKCLSCDLACICKSCPAVRERYYGAPTIVNDEDCAFAKALKTLIEEEMPNG